MDISNDDASRIVLGALQVRQRPEDDPGNPFHAAIQDSFAHRFGGREPTDDGSAYATNRGAGRTKNAIVFRDPKNTRYWLPIGEQVSVAGLQLYAYFAISSAGYLGGYDVEFLLAVASEMRSRHRDVEPIPILVQAIAPEQRRPWARVTLHAIASTGFEQLAYDDRIALARIHATLVKMMPDNHTGAAGLA